MTSITMLVCAEEPRFSLTGGQESRSGKSGYNLANSTEPVSYNKNDAKNIDPAGLKPAPTPADAVAYALADVSTLPKGDQPFQRYVWIPNGDKKLAGAVNYTLNISWSRATPLIKSRIVAQGRLVRVDLRTLAPRADIEGKDFRDLFVQWEKLAFEPYFHITRTTEDALPTNAKLIRSLDDDPTGSIRFKIEDKTWYKSPAGRTYCLNDKGRFEPQKLEFAKKENVAVAGSHVGLDQHVMLQGLTQSTAPVVRYDWFVIKSLTTLNGGIYYDLLGIEKKPAKGTALDAFFTKFGYDPKEVAKLRADQRVAMFKSQVTGRPRRVDFFRGQGVRPDSGTGLGTITFDPSEEQIAAENDPIRNLLDFKSTASEVILERANGMHAFGLFNKDGDLQDSAPDNVVKDHTIPTPYPARLQSGISCIRCHNPVDGWQPAQNDVRLMLNGFLNVYDDLADKKGVATDVLDRLVGLYAGDLTKSLRRARDDYSDAVYAVTNGQTVPQAGATLANIFIDYQYTDVSAATACLELGYNVPADKAVYYLNMVLPPLQRDVVGISPEDPIIGALKVGLKVQRYQWESVYADAAFRAAQSRKEREKVKK
jgi:hypothetical protein